MIKIVSGVYGYQDKNGIVKAKTSDDAPFALEKSQEKRLVDLGVAVYVDKVAEEMAEDDVPVFDENTNANELRKIAKSMDIAFPVGTTKKEMVEILREHTEENAVDDDLEMPSIDVVLE